MNIFLPHSIYCFYIIYFFSFNVDPVKRNRERKNKHINTNTNTNVEDDLFLGHQTSRMLLRSGPLRSPAKHLSTARGAPSASLTFLDLSWNAIGSKGGKVKNIFFLFSIQVLNL